MAVATNIFDPNDPTSVIAQQQISGAPFAAVKPVATAAVGTAIGSASTIPEQPTQTALNNPNAPPSLFNGVVSNAQVGTNPILTTPPTPEQTALSNPNAPPVQPSNLTLPPAPEQTALNNPNAPPVAPAETQAIDNVDKVVKTATTPAGGTTATAGTQPATATTPETQTTNVPTISPTVTGVTPVASASTADTSQSAKMLQNLADTYKAQTNPYMDKLNTMTFSYNPQDDPDYKLAASQMEQQVTDMMVGRGGLYSSVTSSALQSRLTELMGTYRKQAYDMFVQDRNFTMQMAQQEYDRQDKLFQKELQLYSAQTDRENTAWNQNMQMSEFEFNQKKEAFDQSYQLAQFAFAQKQSEFEQQLATAKFNADRQDAANALALQRQQLAISQANAAYNRASAQAAKDQAKAQTTLNMMEAEYRVAYSEWQDMKDKWQSDGAANYEVASYFNVPIGAEPTSQFGNRIEQALYNLNLQAQNVANYAKQVGDAQTYLDSMTGFKTDNTSAAYSEAYNFALSRRAAGEDWTYIAGQLTGMGNQLLSSMGSENYNKLLTYIDTKIKEEEIAKAKSEGDTSLEALINK